MHLTLHRLTVSLFGKQDWENTSFQTKVLDLILHLTDKRIRHARDCVHQHRVRYINDPSPVRSVVAVMNNLVPLVNVSFFLVRQDHDVIVVAVVAVVGPFFPAPFCVRHRRKTVS